MKPTALLSMDVEEWWHLAYMPRTARRADESVLEGVTNFRNLLAAESVPGTFFVLGDVAREAPRVIRALARDGHEIASHGPDHALLGQISTARFREELRSHRSELEQLTGRTVDGYRAPCFSLDRDKLDVLVDLGFKYDSSWIDFPAHPLYGDLDLSGWERRGRAVCVAPAGGFVEFGLPVVELFSRTLPVGGGAYLRFIPWLVYRRLVTEFLRQADVYVFYIHPFECCDRKVRLPEGLGAGNRFRFGYGRGRNLDRVAALVRLLKNRGMRFMTFRDAAAELTRSEP